VANLQERAKPGNGWEEWDKHQSDLPGRCGTARWERIVRNLGDPAGGAERPDRWRECITAGGFRPGVGEVRSSDEAGNDRGAKGPHEERAE